MYMMIVHVLLLLLYSLFMSGGLGLKKDANMMCIEKEREALLVIKADLNMTSPHPYYVPKDEEQKSDCCKWWGVVCNNQSGHVIELHISSSDIALASKISPSLQLLDHLQLLDLSGIDFQSNPMPNFLGSLTNLISLDLSSANLSGPIPHQLSNISSLLHLNLSHNSLRGSIPNLSNTLRLDLSHNFLEGSIPFAFGDQMKELILHRNALSGGVPNITGWSSLITLSLAHNSLNGSIPDFIGCRSLQKLDLSSNRLTSDLPKSVGELSNLEYLDVSNNSLSGVITELHFLNLTKLTYLGLSFNSFRLLLSSFVRLPFNLRTIKLQSCKLGPSFPTWIQSQRNLTHLDISSAGISDNIPAWFWELPSGLKFLNLSSNEINGTLPDMTTLNFESYPGIDLSNNLLGGKLPSLPLIIAALNLSGNRFSGTLSFLCQLDEALTFLDLSKNSFSGTLPDCWLKFRKHMVILNLSNNSLSGEIPSSLGFLSQLEALYLRMNAFVGELPISLSNCTKLRFVDLGENKLSGVIPKWIGEKLSNLYVLVLGTNRFYGRLPSQVCWLYNLQLLDMSKNELSGPIPRCFGNLTAMVKTSSGENMTSHSYSSYVGITPFNVSTICFNLTGAKVTCGRTDSVDKYYDFYYEEAIFTDNAMVAWKGTERAFGSTILKLLKTIDLSSNKLSGNLTDEITGLHGLVSLNFSSNKLHGEVPMHMGRLTSLQSLDLSRNDFSGNIPTSLSRLTFLSYLDLSYNNFSGSIPLGTQLQSFNASSYAGNPRLCGYPLITQRCGSLIPPSAEDDHVEEDDDDDFWKPYFTGMGAGFAVGFWGVCGALFLNRRCRYFFFHVLSFVNDWIYVTGVVHFQKLKRKLSS